MRSDPAVFARANRAPNKRPRFVVKIEFPSLDLYLSSHTGITGIPGSPAVHLAGCLQEPSVSSQKLNPDQGRSEIGSASFRVVDLAGQLTTELRALLADGEGLRDRLCRFYLGYEGLAWSDFVLYSTQMVKGCSYDRAEYAINCNDIQRSTRKDVFELTTTTLASSVTETDTTINVSSTTGFTKVKHGTSYTDAPSSTVGYIKIKDEVIRYTGSTATSFTGCTRGVLGTSAAAYKVDGGTPAARREKVTEYVYLELPGPKLAYAVLTGVLYGDTATLPTGWHLAIPESLVQLADFTGIGADLWDTANDANGVVLRFEGLGKTDGKAFLETEICRLLGLFMPVYSTGLLGLRRMTRVLMDASAVMTLDHSNSVSLGELEHDMESLHNSFSVQWNFNGKDYTRTTQFIDATSAAIHGVAPEMELKFKGLYGGRHTDGLVFKLLDSIRDRYSAPPCRLKRDVLHSLNTIEVGDVVRVTDPAVRDYAGTVDGIDRAFEVQSVSVNHRTGVVALDLFGSTSRASVDSPTTATTALPDAFYTAVGTNLATVMTITGGVVSGGPYTLNGGTDLTAAGSTWYYNGDLTIPVGVTVNITGNVQLRVKGYLTVNGTINGVGGGLAGVADNGTATPVLSGTPGWVGNSRGLDGILAKKLAEDGVTIRTNAIATTKGLHESFPYMALEVVGSTLKGLPTDIRGTGGGPGGKIINETSGNFLASGGTGAAGGAGLCTISRGFGVGANASITLSGAASSAPAAFVKTEGFKTINLFPGTGGSGGPGSFLLLIDGGLLSVPDLAGRFVSHAGVVGLPAYTTALGDFEYGKYKVKEDPFAGYVENPDVISDLDLSFSCHRIQYVPAPETATADVTTLAPPSTLSVAPGAGGFALSWLLPGGLPSDAMVEVWQHTSSTPFSSAAKVAETVGTSVWIPRTDTSAVYCWVRIRARDAGGSTVYSTTEPSSAGLACNASNSITFGLSIIPDPEFDLGTVGGALTWWTHSSQITCQSGDVARFVGDGATAYLRTSYVQGSAAVQSLRGSWGIQVNIRYRVSAALGGSYKTLRVTAQAAKKDGTNRTTTDYFDIDCSGCTVGTWYEKTAVLGWYPAVSESIANPNYVFIDVGMATGALASGTIEFDSLYARTTTAPANMTANTAGAVPAVSSASGKFLKDDATWATPAPPSFVGCRVYSSSDQTVNNNTETAVTFNNETYDTDSIFGGSGSSFTIPAGGKYLVAVCLNWDGNNSGTRAVRIKNGSTVVAEQTVQAGSATVSNLAAVISCTASDTLTVYVYQNSGNARTLTASGVLNHCSISKLG